MGRRDVQRAFDHRPDDVALGGGDDIDGEVVGQQRVEQLHHRLVVGLAALHAGEAPCLAVLEFAHDLRKPVHGHAPIGDGSRGGLPGAHAAGLLAARGIHDLLRHRPDLIGNRVAAAVQRVVREQHVLEAEGIGLAHQRAVKVEHGDAILHGNEIG